MSNFSTGSVMDRYFEAMGTKEEGDLANPALGLEEPDQSVSVSALCQVTGPHARPTWQMQFPPIPQEAVVQRSWSNSRRIVR
jgi:hypothetical protein